ncbi:MAG: sigma factor-like helix-turn-helix DNA-binding protein [Nitriliruptorales bacterium]
MSSPQETPDAPRDSGGGRRGRPRRSGRGDAAAQAGRPPRRGGARPDEEDRVAELARPLERVLRRLPEVERRVVELRMGLVDGYSRNLADTARGLGLTIQEAREIEQRAFERIREVVPLQHLQKYLS